MAERAQLGYDDERYAVNRDIWMMRGDTRHFPFPHNLGPAAAIKSAQIELETDGTAETKVSLTLADHPTQWDFTTDDKGIILFNAIDTASIDLATYRYAIELIDQSDRVYTAQFGSFQLERDVVDNTGTSPYPSWTTLTDLETQISDMASCGLVTWLTAVVTGGAQSVIEVQNGAIATGTPGIRLILTNGSYEDDTIASIDGNEWTVAGTFAGEAAIGKPVRIL